jgi:hypothetical protein
MLVIGFDCVRSFLTIHAEEARRDGPARLLLHGYPQTHIIRHRIGDSLADQLTVNLSGLGGDDSQFDFGEGDSQRAKQGKPGAKRPTVYDTLERRKSK